MRLVMVSVSVFSCHVWFSHLYYKEHLLAVNTPPPFAILHPSNKPIKRGEES